MKTHAPVLFAAFQAAAPAPAQTGVDRALVLAIAISGSMDLDAHALQSGADAARGLPDRRADKAAPPRSVIRHARPAPPP